MKCTVCEDTGWVRENHSDTPHTKWWCIQRRQDEEGRLALVWAPRWR